MTTSAITGAPAHEEKHPKGLYVLFATEMWERFSFYSMLAMFTLYLRDTTGQGFAWSVRQRYRALRQLSDVRLRQPVDRRLARGSEARLPQGGHDRRPLLHGGPPSPFHSLDPGRLPRADLPGHRQRFLQAERFGHGRQPLYRREPSQGSRLQHLLHGHQRGRVSRPGDGGNRAAQLGIPSRLCRRRRRNGHLRFHPVEIQAPHPGHRSPRTDERGG